MAASSLIIAATMAGCSGASVSNRVDAHASNIGKMAEAQAQEAEKALSRKDAARAVAAAEAAVAAEPKNAGYRSVLGRSYLADGRYASARTAFEDALTLGGGDSRTIVNLALVRAAQGDFTQAQDVLSAHMDKLSAADYGLAMALSGNAHEAIRLLSQAIHDPGATSKERQNLAYAHALAGEWVEARQMASLDLAPAEAVKRVAYWAQMAQPGAETARVAAMIGVPVREDDAGLPARLALNAAGQDAVRLADGDTAGTGVTDGDKALLAAVADEKHSASPLPSLYGPSSDAPVVMPAALPAQKAGPKKAPAKITKLALPELDRAQVKASKAVVTNPAGAGKSSKWVVQLGAFSTQQAAQISHKQQIKRNSALTAYQAVNSKVQVGGKTHYRLALAGFGSQAEAQKLCASIKAQRGSCFVRQSGAEAPAAQWVNKAGSGGGKASANKQRVALR